MLRFEIKLPKIGRPMLDWGLARWFQRAGWMSGSVSRLMIGTVSDSQTFSILDG